MNGAWCGEYLVYKLLSPVEQVLSILAGVDGRLDDWHHILNVFQFKGCRRIQLVVTGREDNTHLETVETGEGGN